MNTASRNQSSSQFFRNFADLSYFKFSVIFLLHVSTMYKILHWHKKYMHVYESLKKNRKAAIVLRLPFLKKLTQRKRMPPFEHRFRKGLDSVHPSL